MRELSLNIMDIAQNSISAKATLITIGVSESVKNNKTILTIKDNGIGMTEEQVNLVIDPFFTSRTTRNVGLGIPLFKMAAEQTGGSFKIDSKVGKGTKIFAEFIPSHMDMTPIGDINSTISILISCNPNIDFIYNYKNDKGSFTLNTIELKEVLGNDVPLNNPDVVTWVENYLKEQAGLLN